MDFVLIHPNTSVALGGYSPGTSPRFYSAQLLLRRIQGGTLWPQGSSHQGGQWMAPGHQGQPGEAAKDGHGETKASVFGKASWPFKMNEEKKHVYIYI